MAMSRLAKSLIHTITRNKVGRALLFRVCRLVARVFGVEKTFLDRFKVIYCDHHSPANALRFLVCCLKLKFAIRPVGFAYNISAQLKTDEERKKLDDLIVSALERTVDSGSKEALQLQLFRVREMSHKESPVRDYAHQIMQQAIEKKIGQKTVAEYSALERNGMKALVELHEVFSQHGKRFFLISGTLLGAIRDHGFVKNDNDIDLGVFASEISRAEIKRMLAGTSFFIRTDHECKIGYLSKSGVVIDFFIFRNVGNRVEMCNQSGVMTWSFTPFGLETYSLEGQEFFVPENRALVLKENYGNWQTKTLFYDYAFDVPCNRFNDNIDAVLRLTDKLTHAIQTGDRFTAQKCVTVLTDQFGIDSSELPSI